MGFRSSYSYIFSTYAKCPNANLAYTMSIPDSLPPIPNINLNCKRITQPFLFTAVDYLGCLLLLEEDKKKKQKERQ